MITSAIKKQTSVCCSISLNPYGISNLESRIKKVKRKKNNSNVSLLLMSAALAIAPFICEHCSL